MVFQSSIKRELARSFAATLLVLTTVVMTMTLLRTVGDASRGTFNPADVMLIMGYTALSDMPTILTLSLFIGILSMLTRLYQDSEMVIWFGSGVGLARLLPILWRFAWPVLLMIAALAILILPWAFSKIEDLRFEYERRGDIARIEPGQFQESADGSRVFFIEKDKRDMQVGKNVFMSTIEDNKQTITTGQEGRLELHDSDKYLVLENGQRTERVDSGTDVTITQFEQYGARVGRSAIGARDYAPSQSIPTWDLLVSNTPEYMAELAWRLGLPLTAFNLITIALALAGANPRASKVGSLAVAFLAFVAYFNLLLVGKSWVHSGHMRWYVLLLVLHGSVCLVSTGWLVARHWNWNIPALRRLRPIRTDRTDRTDHTPGVKP